MPKSMHIPRIGEVFELAEPWTFTLHDEHRNQTLINQVKPGYNASWRGSGTNWQVTLPAGFELKVVRVYIRQNQAAYNSVTFTCPYNGKRVRFWVKLDDANRIVMVDPEP